LSFRSVRALPKLSRIGLLSSTLRSIPPAASAAASAALAGAGALRPPKKPRATGAGAGAGTGAAPDSRDETTARYCITILVVSVLPAPLSPLTSTHWSPPSPPPSPPRAATPRASASYARAPTP